jgi:hypothetical protein
MDPGRVIAAGHNVQPSDRTETAVVAGMHRPAWERYADALLQRAVLRCRVGLGRAPRDFPGAFVAHEDVDRILREIPGLDGPPAEQLEPLLDQLRPIIDNTRADFVKSLDGDEPLARIARHARLTADESALFATIAAVELDPDRQRLAVYLQDSIHHPRLALDALRRLFGDAVGTLSSAGRLRTSRLARLGPDGPWATRMVEVPERVVWALTGDTAPDPGLPSLAELLPATDSPDQDGVRLLLVTGGDRTSRLGVARTHCAAASLLVTPLPDGTTEWDAVVREATVSGAAVFLEVDGGVSPVARRQITRTPHLTWLVGSSHEIPVETLPDVEWREVRAAAEEAGEDEWRELLGRSRDGHRLSREQLHLVARTAPSVNHDLDAAVRRLASGHLDGLAMRVPPRRGWDDLVLPPDQTTALRELTARYRHRRTVHGPWGFAAVPSSGLVALFAGPSGTGKTLAAEVVAGDVGLDLYKVDLSSVVSKYIGETEKNLASVFAAASAGHVVLFFDEADALFGKRSEVSDAHDRYANIEVAYLLQRIEAYDGLVILATNLQRNLDQAFLRRIHVAVEFPPPDEPQRRAIWQRSFPPAAPVADLDFDFLARQFTISGGTIHNAAVAAAFLAAERGAPITMDAVIQALGREFGKLGRLRTEAEFGRYFDLVRHDAEPAVPARPPAVPTRPPAVLEGLEG